MHRIVLSVVCGSLASVYRLPLTPEHQVETLRLEIEKRVGNQKRCDPIERGVKSEKSKSGVKSGKFKTMSDNKTTPRRLICLRLQDKLARFGCGALPSSSSA